MLSPALHRSILSSLQVNATGSMQSPSHQEAEFISQQIRKCSPSGIHMLVELTAELGVQSMSFLANHLSPNHLMCSSTVPQLCANLSAFTNNTHDKEPQTHFILAEKHSLFRSIPSEVKRAVSGSKLVVVYMDVYAELDSLEAMQGKKPVAFDGQSLEASIQRLCEDACWQTCECLLVFRLPQWLEQRVVAACGCFDWKVETFEQKEASVSSKRFPLEARRSVRRT